MKILLIFFGQLYFVIVSQSCILKTKPVMNAATVYIKLDDKTCIVLYRHNLTLLTNILKRIREINEKDDFPGLKEVESDVVLLRTTIAYLKFKNNC